MVKVLWQLFFKGNFHFGRCGDDSQESACRDRRDKQPTVRGTNTYQFQGRHQMIDGLTKTQSCTRTIKRMM